MTQHYFRLALRSLGKHKYNTLINIFGLVCGMFSVLVIAKYIGGKLQFDSFHLNRNQIYTITQKETGPDGDQHHRMTTYFGMGDLAEQFPEVHAVSKFSYHVESLVIVGNDEGEQESFTEDRIFMTDSSFLRMFTFPLMHGDGNSALSKPFSVVLGASTARKYFGDSNPVGKSLTIRTPWSQETVFQITGVAAAIPARSRFQFDILITRPAEESTFEAWTVPDCSTHVLLKETTDRRDLARKINQLLKEVPDLKSREREVVASLEPLREIRLSTTEYILGTVGIFVVLICWVNYINQCVGQSYWRTKETGIFKILGATNMQLRKQFLLESIVVCLISLLLIIVCFVGMDNYLQTLTNGHMLPLIDDPTYVNEIFLLIFVCGIALTASVPSLILSTQKFGATLSRADHSAIRGAGIRKALVVLQFSISTVLVVSVFVISKQHHHIMTKEKGINIDNLLVIRSPMVKDTRLVRMKTLELFKQQCAGLPFISGVSSSTTVPSEEYRHETYFTLEGDEHKVLVHQSGVDEHFFSLYQAQFLAGHDFVPDARAQNMSSIVLNESAARAMGFTDFEKMIGLTVIDHEEEGGLIFNVIGVIKDFHQTSLKYEVRPLAFKYNVFRGHCTLKLNLANQGSGALTAALDELKKLWEQNYPGAPFEYFFVDEKFRAQNDEDRTFGHLLQYFTLLSTTLSCLGLYGLSMLISTKREKEIGIRKTFGASPAHILWMFIKGYAGALASSILTGVPLAYLLMNAWLTNYASRIGIGFGLLMSSVAVLIVIFLGAISYHTLKAAAKDPVTVLRN